MEKKAKTTIPLDYIRGLIVAQEGRCAITGLPLDPQDVSADHILPLSRQELSPSMGTDNIWIVHKRVNAMKGTMTYDELLEMATTIIQHRKKTKELLGKIERGKLNPVSKAQFDQWVEKNCAENGRIRT